MLLNLADGSWLTRDRLRAVCLIAGLMSLVSLLYLFATANGTLDHLGRPLGTDFSNVWTAGRMALNGQAGNAWDWAQHYRVQQAAHGDPDVPFYGWHYPPPFLLLATALAMLPYTAALLLWQASSFAAALFVLHRILPRREALWAGLAAPVALICLGHGHNGFLTAALLGGGLLLLDRRPLFAGLLLGCLIYKPQLGLVIPILLLVLGQWRAIAGACASAGMLIAATLIIWGPGVWEAFIGSIPLTTTQVIESGSTGWHKIHTPFAWARMWGADVEEAYLLHSLAAGAAVALTLLIARRAAPAQRNMAVIAAGLIVTPYAMDYDFVPLGLGAAFLVRDGLERGFLSWEKSALAFLWLAPLFARQVAEATLMPVGQLCAILALGVAVRRAVILDAVSLPGFRSWPFRHSRAASGR